MTRFFYFFNLLSSVRPFLQLTSALTGFHVWGLVTRWAQLLITSNYYLPSTLKDQSSMRADLTEQLRIELEFLVHTKHALAWKLPRNWMEQKNRKVCMCSCMRQQLA